MSSYDDEKTNLKSIFGDNKYPTGNNFAELINLPDFRLAENNDGTITINNITYDMTKSDLGSIAQISEDFNSLPNGLTFVSNGQNNAPESTSAYWVRTFNSSAYSSRKLQVAQSDGSNNRYIRIYNGNWNNWDSLATGSELATKVTDNKNGSITVNGATFVPADDNKVAYLSGANNFDTVPTVNNNPLLLASSLPSDLARTGSDQEFTGKNTFDTAPIDKTTGNPYITKDGVPSDVARTSQQTNFTAGLQSGGVSVATSDDLKSVEESAWRILTPSMSSINPDIKSETILYQVDTTNKCLNILISMYVDASSTYSTYSIYGSSIPCAPLGSIITGISSIDLSSFNDNDIYRTGQSGTTNSSQHFMSKSSVTYSGTTLALKSDSGGGWDGLKFGDEAGHAVISSASSNSSYGKVYYTGLQAGVIQ